MNRIKEILRESLILEERIKFNMVLPEDIIKINNIFKNNGYKLYVVGGSIRDAIMGLKPKDYDLATDAIPDEVEKIMNQANIRTLPTGKAFGVINVFIDNEEYEIATFRSESYSDADKRRPDSVNFTNIEGDVKRRDLTINALFYDINTHEIVDLVGGIEDIKNGVVRTVGQPEDRFKEDKLRILRAIRFAGRFGSELDSATDLSLQKDSSLEGISGERIRDEFIKGLKTSKSQKHFLEMLDKYKLFHWIFKGLNVDKRGFVNEDDYILLIAKLLKNNNINIIRKVLNDLKYSIDEVKGITFLIAMLNLNVDTAVLLKKAEEHSGISPEQIKKFCKSEGINNNLVKAFEKFHLSVSGQEVMDKTGLKPSKELGDEILRIETENFKNLL